MLLRLCLLFIIVPMVELVLLTEIGSRIGLAPTLGIILLTGVIGAWLARREGTRAWKRVHENLEAGRVPARELVDGILIFAAGLLLVTPGFLTDAAGFAMLTPRVRDWLWRVLKRYFETHVHTHVVTRQQPGWTEPDSNRPDEVEGRAIRVEDADEEG